jgi:uncharacterized protein YeaO (DUF488 family)
MEQAEIAEVIRRATTPHADVTTAHPRWPYCRSASTSPDGARREGFTRPRNSLRLTSPSSMRWWLAVAPDQAAWRVDRRYRLRERLRAGPDDAGGALIDVGDDLLGQEAGKAPMSRASRRLAIKRVYEPPAPTDGCRVLVDRLWPRGLTKQRAGIDVWLRDIAPSSGLRTWFGHDPDRWPEFQDRYFTELRTKPEEIAQLAALSSAGQVTLLFAARDTEHNHAVALGAYLASL